MAILVNTNIPSLISQANFENVSNRINSSLEKLTSGSRINSASDDAAGLQISNRLTIQILGLNQANRNANDGISIAQIAEGSLGEITTNVQRMRQLALQAANNTLSDSDRDALKTEFSELLSTNANIADNTKFGDRQLLDGSAPIAGFSFHTGSGPGSRDSVTTGNATLKGLLEGVAEDDSTITASTALICAITNDTVSLYGAVGEILAAYAALDSTANVSTVAESFFGLSGGESIALTELSSSLVTINTDEFSKLIGQDELKNGDGTYATVASLYLAATGFGNDILSAFETAGLTAVDSVNGFTSTQIQVLRDFTSDSLMDALSDVITQVDSIRATLGAEQNGLNSIVSTNSLSILNVSEARSRIQDTDFASEVAEYTRNQIIQQISTSVIAQANQQPNVALSLLNA